jgi:hypothetical protein
MTKAEFLKALKKVAAKRPFLLGQFLPCIRTVDGRCCPLVAVARSLTKKRPKAADGLAAAEALGMRFRTADAIMSAADDEVSEFRPEIVRLRQQLLKACGLPA